MRQIVEKKVTLHTYNKKMASKTREKLIEVARQLFAHKGVAHTTMNDIANASSKGRRTIYTYFKSKKEIYNAVLEQESERLVNSLRELVSLDEPIEKRLGMFLHKRLNRYLTPSPTASFKSWISFDNRRLAKIRAMARDKENEMLRALLAEGCEKGVFDKERCDLVVGFMSLAVSSEDVHVLEIDSLSDRQKAFDNFVEFVVTSLMTKENKRSSD